MKFESLRLPVLCEIPRGKLEAVEIALPILDIAANENSLVTPID